MKKFLLILLFAHPVLAQKDTLSNWRFGFSKCFGEIGYSFQNEHVWEIGLKLEYIRVKGSGSRYERMVGKPSLKSWHAGEGFSFMVGGQISKRNDISYLNPFVTARYLFGSFENRPVIAFTFSNRNIGGITVNTVTPEIGINLSSILSIMYGYNLFLSERYDWVSKHRLGLKLMLF